MKERLAFLPTQLTTNKNLLLRNFICTAIVVVVDQNQNSPETVAVGTLSPSGKVNKVHWQSSLFVERFSSTNSSSGLQSASSVLNKVQTQIENFSMTQCQKLH